MPQSFRIERSVTRRLAGVTAHTRAHVRNAATVALGSWLDDGHEPRGHFPPPPAPRGGAAASGAPDPSPRPRRRLIPQHLTAAVVVLAAVVAASPVAVGGGPHAAPGSSPAQAARRSSPGAVAARDGVFAGRPPSAPDAGADGAPAAVGASAWRPRQTSVFDASARLAKPLTVGPTASTSVPPRPRVQRYRTVKGDALSVLAQRFGVSTMTIWWANKLRDKDTLRVGQLLRIAPTSGTVHVVRDGDTLGSIARIYRADPDAIATYNGVRGGVPVLGQRLVIPGGRGGRYVAHEVEPDAPPAVPGLELEERFVDEAPAHVIVAAPLEPSSSEEHKATGGVGWPSDPDTSASAGAWSWDILDQGTNYRPAKNRAPTTGAGGDQGNGGGGDHDGGHAGGNGGSRSHQHDDGPERGPPQGTVLDIHDRRLRLTGARVLEMGGLHWPVKGYSYLTQHFHDEHLGIDIGAALGTKVVAVADGRVMFRGWRDNRSGYAVWVKHGPNLFTTYNHLSKVDVELGQWVDAGEVVGRIGSTGYSTGPHLHFTVTVGGDRPDVVWSRVDPLEYLAPR